MHEATSVKQLLFWHKSPQVRDKSKTRGRKQEVPKRDSFYVWEDHPPHTEIYFLFLKKKKLNAIKEEVCEMPGMHRSSIHS